ASGGHYHWALSPAPRGPHGEGRTSEEDLCEARGRVRGQAGRARKGGHTGQSGRQEAARWREGGPGEGGCGQGRAREASTHEAGGRQARGQGRGGEIGPGEVRAREAGGN